MSATSAPAEQLDRCFAALANATRRQILVALSNGEASVNELAEPFAMSLPAISRHLKVLEHAGLVHRGKRAQYRPCRLNADALVPVSEWADTCRASWLASFDRLDSYLDQLQPDPQCDQPQADQPQSDQPQSDTGETPNE